MLEYILTSPTLIGAVLTVILLFGLLEYQECQQESWIFLYVLAASWLSNLVIKGLW